MHWTAEAIRERVDRLAEEHDGPAFVEAVKRFGEQLDGAERELLGGALLARAQVDGAFDYALEERIRARGWLRRTWDSAARPRR